MPAKKILLVEGKDDEHVLKHICGNRGILHLDEIKEHGGVDELLESVPVRLKASSDGDIVGIIIDADTDLGARWQSLREQLVHVGYHDVPMAPLPEGTVIDPPADALLPRVGIWIMPDNRTTGILEDFLQFLVPTGSRLFDHVITSVDTIPPDEVRFNLLTRPKALIHTWLAWQDEPGKPLGIAITAKYLDAGVTKVDLLVSWLNRLFILE